MAIFKDFFDIPKDLYDRFVKKRQKVKLQISDYLFAIADSLGKIKTQLESKQLPTEDGNFLNEIIKHANNFSKPLKRKYPELAQVFDNQLRKIVFEIQINDYYLDGKPRWDASLSENAENIILTKTHDSQISKASDVIKKAVGIISAHATRFKIEGS